MPSRQILLNAFDMNCVGHIQHGLWTHPRDRSTEYNTIGYWQDLARLAERGKFDTFTRFVGAPVRASARQMCPRWQFDSN